MAPAYRFPRRKRGLFIKILDTSTLRIYKKEVNMEVIDYDSGEQAA